MTPTYRPSEEQELVLRAALLPGDAARTAWRHVHDRLAMGTLDSASESVLPLVYDNVCRQGGGAGIEILRDRYLRTWSENLRAYHGVLPLLQAFEQAGIDAIALKGLAMIARFYRDPAVRPMADVDVLVRPGDLAQAAELAAGLGWHPRHRLTPAFVRVKHAGPFDHGVGVAVDVHWRVFEEAAAPEADEALRAAAEVISFQGHPLRVLSPTDQLLHVCGHAARWSEVPAIRWATDAVAILRQVPIDWRRLLHQTVERRFVLRMREMLRYVRQTFAVAVPPWVEADLAALPASALERLEHRVRTREQRLLGELPTYVFNCLRAEPHPLRAFPGYLRDAWELPSLTDVPACALRLALRRVGRAIAGRADSAR